MACRKPRHLRVLQEIRRLFVDGSSEVLRSEHWQLVPRPPNLLIASLLLGLRLVVPTCYIDHRFLMSCGLLIGALLP